MGNTSPMAERIRAHFRGLGMQSIPVPEWDGAVVYWKPITLAERAAALEIAGKRPLAFYAAIVTAKALDESGARMFNDHDRHVLLNEADATVVMRVGEAMCSVSEAKPLGE